MAIPVVTHRVVAKTADYQIESRKDRSGTIFTNRGAGDIVVFTLPPPGRCTGWEYTFLAVSNDADADITVRTQTADTLITFNDIDADSVTASTTGQIIGAVIKAYCDGTSWIANVVSNGTTQTVVD
jgi:hypothetical protein